MQVTVSGFWPHRNIIPAHYLVEVEVPGRSDADFDGRHRGFLRVKVSDDFYSILYVQEVVTQPKILNRTTLSNIIHVT